MKYRIHPWGNFNPFCKLTDFVHPRWPNPLSALPQMLHSNHSRNDILNQKLCMNTSNFKLQTINKPTLPLYFSEDIILQTEFSIKWTIFMFVHPLIGKSSEKSIWALDKNLFGNLPKSFASLKTILSLCHHLDSDNGNRRPKERTFY